MSWWGPGVDGRRCDYISRASQDDFRTEKAGTESEPETREQDQDACIARTNTCCKATDLTIMQGPRCSSAYTKGTSKSTPCGVSMLFALAHPRGKLVGINSTLNARQQVLGKVEHAAGA